MSTNTSAALKILDDLSDALGAVPDGKIAVADVEKYIRQILGGVQGGRTKIKKEEPPLKVEPPRPSKKGDRRAVLQRVLMRFKAF